MSLKQLEIILLGMMVFVLPSLETPKTLFWALYVLVFLIRKHRDGELWQLPSAPVVLALWGILLVSLISTLMNWPIENGFKGVFDALRYISLFLCIYAGGYTDKDFRNIALAVIAGAIAGLSFGLLEVITNVVSRLQFHSAGVVTQSAIYLSMVIVLTLGFIMQCRDLTKAMRGVLIAVLSIMAIGLAYMGSRGSLLAVFTVLGVIILANLRWRVVLGLLIGTGLIAIASYFVIKLAPQNILNEGHYERLSVERFNKADNERVEAWKISLAKLASGEDVIWGIGPKNFRSINPSDLGIQSAFYERTGVIHHAHNLFLTTLVETGVIGLSMMLAFYFLIFIRLYRSRRSQLDSGAGWMWYAGLGGFMVPIIAGSFNAPFSGEFAMLAMILMAMMYVSVDTNTAAGALEDH
ncbi:MAG TPA: hypothetical protein DDW55_12900 [Gammaproteobacteria bacterium]|nr:hypothetical protein [Gammaproteobacteria bacterium]